ncbi:SDR family NAD(P)-dependent oxidoreductase [Saccharothrix deserti]|uniref:SDR family NAD(P)-dependent oxidoreductase n=1 Tax=Saccharothrix deserti TaxID=2593674 RepID=UPI001EE47940|nr:SDR family NAD(P)-dependent oxidoreductase [Saccharothrix deserti]
MVTATRITTPFNAWSTAAEVIAGVDLTGRRAVVTGAASGIGVETARALASAGTEVTLAVRDTAAGHRTAAEIKATTGAEDVRVGRLELSDPTSVRAFVAAWRGPLHILVNNAGVMAAPETRTSRGWELQLATNHLGHFALATGLHGALAAAEGARVVSVSSSGHLFSLVVFDDLHFTNRPYDPWLAYGQSKTANVLFAVEGARRWSGDVITVNALMPGAIFTNLMRYVGDSEQTQFNAHLQALVGEARELPGVGPQDDRAGRRDLGAAGLVTGARRRQRPVLRGLRRGCPTRSGHSERRRGARLGPGSRHAALGRLRATPRVIQPPLARRVPMPKMWFVTGSSRGLGRSFVEAVLERGGPAWSRS